jgi:hypothetical protein
MKLEMDFRFEKSKKEIILKNLNFYNSLEKVTLLKYKIRIRSSWCSSFGFYN